MGNILVEIVPRNAPITVNRTHVDRQTDCVLVLQDGQVIIVAQVIFRYYLVNTVLPRRVTELTACVCFWCIAGEHCNGGFFSEVDLFFFNCYWGIYTSKESYGPFLPNQDNWVARP